MKNTLWANHMDKSTVSVLNKSGFYTNEDFDDIPVLGLLLMIGIDREDVDELLKALFFEENTWRLGIKDILESATEREGHEYMRDIFEAYSFDEYPDRFYKMTVRELLDLEFIEERFIPFVTSLMQRYLQEQDENISTYFVERMDITSRKSLKKSANRSRLMRFSVTARTSSPKMTMMNSVFWRTEHERNQTGSDLSGRP